MTNKKLKYLTVIDGKVQLKKDSTDGYYVQVQIGMTVSGIKLCDLLVITIPFSKKYWVKEMEPALTHFLIKYAAPAIFAGQRYSMQDSLDMSNEDDLEECLHDMSLENHVNVVSLQESAEESASSGCL